MGLFSWLFKKNDKSKSEIKAEAELSKIEAPVASEISKEESAAEEALAESIALEGDFADGELKGVKGAFELKKSKDGRYVFNLYASNKKIIATSRVYSSATRALGGINSVIQNAPRALVEDRTLKKYDTLPFPKWEMYIDREGKYRFRLHAQNGTCILRSQGYTQKSSCKNGIESVITNSKQAKIDKAYLAK